MRCEPDLPPGAILRVGTERFRHRHDSGQAVFSPDGKVVASASLRYGTAVSKDDGRTGVVEFWEAATGRLLASRPGRKVAFAADGRSMAILDLDAVRVYDWPKPGEKPRTELTREVRDVVEFALSPNGRTVILSNDGNSVGLITGRYNFHDLGHPTVLMLVDTPRWTELERVELPESTRINALAYLTDHVVACGENDGQISLRDAGTGKILGRYIAHRTGDLQLNVSAIGSCWSSLGKTALVWESDKLPKP